MVFFRLLSLLMCVQVLVCPALCVAKCAHKSTANVSQSKSAEVVAKCDCCSKSMPTNGEPSDSKRPGPTKDSSDCPDCFCSGSLVLGKDSVADIEFDVVSSVVHSLAMDLFIQQPSCIAANQENSSPPLFGRELLRRYCELLI